MSDLILVKRFYNRLEAELAKSFLEAGGIESMITADDCGGMSPPLSMSTGLDLVVKREDGDRAADVLARKEP